MRYRVSYLMDEIWERAVETALNGQTDESVVRSLTLDGAVKCVHGRLPPPNLLEKFQNLQHLSIANIGVSSLEQFPRLRNLQRLILSDNRIASGLEFLVVAGLDSLRDLDLSNNRIQFIGDLAPLAQLRLVSLDLYECPVTREKDYRSRVFGLIKSLKYLDKMDAEENERPESDDEEDEEEDEEEDPGSGEVDGEEHPGIGEVDGEEHPYRLNNGHSLGNGGIVDEDEESDADEEIVTNHQANGFLVAAMNGDVDGEDEDEDNDSGEEVDDEEDDDDVDDVVEVHEIEDSDDEEDGVEDDDIDEDDEDGSYDDEEEEVDNDDGVFAIPDSTGRLTGTEGEIDGHDQGEDDVEDDDNGETGEDELGVEVGEFDEDDEEGEDEEEDFGSGYLVQPVTQPEGDDGEDSDMDPGDDDEEEEEVEDEDEPQLLAPSSSNFKRKRDEDAEDDNDDEEDDDIVDHGKSSKKHH